MRETKKQGLDRRAETTIQRPIADLVEALRRHVRLLRQYERKAFVEHDDDYLGEVAAKLRLLAIRKPRNVPLLVELMCDCRVSVRIEPKGSRPANWGDTGALTLKEFLDQSALSVKTSTGDVPLTKRELIEVFAEKHGGAHEDWEHPEWLAIVRDSRVRIKGHSSLAVSLFAGPRAARGSRTFTSTTCGTTGPRWRSTGGSRPRS